MRFVKMTGSDSQFDAAVIFDLISLLDVSDVYWVCTLIYLSILLPSLHQNIIANILEMKLRRSRWVHAPLQTPFDWNYKSFRTHFYKFNHGLLEVGTFLAVLFELRSK